MNKKIDDILFYTATSVRPPKEGLEKALENITVTNYENYRYNNVMGLKLAIPIGIIILILMVFVATSGKSNQPQSVTVLPSKVTKQNVDASLNQVDSSIGTSTDEMDKDLQDLDKEDNTSEDLNSL